MKILYAIQGTGNGHISRTREIVPILQKMHDVDILVSGVEYDVELPFKVDFHFKGLSFVFGKKGGIDLVETYKKNKMKRLLKEISMLDTSRYDLVLNDFEPVSAWACFMQKKTCISISHQSAVLNPNAPKPKKNDPIGKLVLKKYAPVSSAYGFHFQPYDSNIFTPVIRIEVREQEVTDQNFYLVYLPAYSDKRIIRVLKEFKNESWLVFSKKCKESYTEKNITIQPINNDLFVKSLASATGVLCGAGFETPAEALFMKKKLMVIPMKGQYEQQCNAAALKKMGVPVVKSLNEKYIDKIYTWLTFPQTIIIDYPDQTENILKKILKQHAPLITVLQKKKYADEQHELVTNLVGS